MVHKLKDEPTNKYARQRRQQALEDCLDILCRIAGRQITVFLPEDELQRIPYLKKEIQKTMDMIDD